MQQGFNSTFGQFLLTLRNNIYLNIPDFAWVFCLILHAVVSLILSYQAVTVLRFVKINAKKSNHLLNRRQQFYIL